MGVRGGEKLVPYAHTLICFCFKPCSLLYSKAEGCVDKLLFAKWPKKAYSIRQEI